MRRIALLSGDRTKAVSLAFDKGALVVSSESQEVGDGSQEIAGRVRRDPRDPAAQRALPRAVPRGGRNQGRPPLRQGRAGPVSGPARRAARRHPELSLRRHADADVKGFVEILSLTSDAFRNLASGRLEFHPRLNLVVGDNGQGKTNLLEALALVSGRASFRTRDLAEVRTHLAPRAVLSARVRDGRRPANGRDARPRPRGRRPRALPGRQARHAPDRRPDAPGRLPDGARPRASLGPRGRAPPRARPRRARRRPRARAHALAVREGPRLQDAPPRALAALRRGRDGRVRGDARRDGRPGGRRAPRDARAPRVRDRPRGRGPRHAVPRPRRSSS